MIKKKTSKIIIGILIAETSGTYNSTLWNGAMDAARIRGVSLLCYSGENITYNDAYQYHNMPNKVYELINTDIISGLVLTTSIINFITPEQYRYFCGQFKSVPLVSIGSISIDIPQCIIENKKAMYRLIEHLIKHHGHRRIAYISGPEGSVDARNRLEAFKEALQDNQIPYNPELVYTGDFLYSSGEKAAKQFLEKRGQFDAVVAANDDMAIGAINIFSKADVNIPKDIAVVGFDDIEEAISINPPLSTVKQPVYEQAYKAVNILIDLIEGKPINQIEYLSSDIILRQSCGCFTKKSVKQQDDRKTSSAIKDCCDFTEIKQKTYQQIATKYQKNFIEEIMEKIHHLINTFYNDISGNTEHSFLSMLHEILSSLVIKNIDITIWQMILADIKENLPEMKPNEYNLAENIFQQAICIFYQLLFQSKAKHNIQINFKKDMLHRRLQNLSANIEWSKLIENIISCFKDLKIPSYYLSLYDHQHAKDKSCILILANDDRGIQKDISIRFPADQLIPDIVDYIKSKSYFVCNLYYDIEHLGFIVMEINETYGFIYEWIIPQLSSSLKAGFLLRSSQMTEKKLQEKTIKIETLIKPMLETLKSVYNIAHDKMNAIQSLNELSKISFQKITDTNEIIEKIHSNSNKIAEIITIIDDISSNLNISAINASIESTHAGSYGKGFAVIAKKIRHLSESTHKNSEEISRTLTQVIHTAQESIESSKASIKTFNEQENSIKELLDSLKTIADEMEILSLNSKEILNVMDQTIMSVNSFNGKTMCNTNRYDVTG